MDHLLPVLTDAEFASTGYGTLLAFDARLRDALRREAAKFPAQRREESRTRWLAGQRYEEWARAYNEAVDHVNRERGRAANKRQAAKVHAQTCTTCFQLPAANGECGC